MPIESDITAIEELKRDLARIKTVSLGRLAERGYQLLRAEVPYETGNLKQGVAPPEIKGDTATLTVSARSARRGPRSAVLHLKNGKTRNITLRAIEPYNYARVVAEGYAERIRPKTAKALLIPVPTVPTDESYIESNGQYFVVRKTSGTIKANPYHERAAKRLEGEAVVITEAVIQKVMNG